MRETFPLLTSRPSSLHPSEAAPAIFIVPADDHVLGPDALPPARELRARDVERHGRDQVVEDDGVLLAPAEAGDGVQVVIVEQMARKPRAAPAPVERPVD